MKYDGLLMLSGGKDSCSLAFDLKAQGLNILCFTLDNSFLSEVAKSNIDKTVRVLDFDSVILRPRSSEYIKFIEAKKSLVETCSACSLRTLEYALETAKASGIDVIYAGFTKYTAQAQGWIIRPEFQHEGFTIKYPYEKDYDLKKIKDVLFKNGIEFDPTKTNCQHIRALIKRDVDHCFEKEIELMHQGGQIDDREREYYSNFLESCRVS